MSTDNFKPDAGVKAPPGNETNDELALAMDNTSVQEISIMENENYSQRIIKGANEVYNPTFLQELKDHDLSLFYRESRKQILSMWHAEQALTVHTDKFNVLLQIKAGNILFEVERTFRKKNDFTAWQKENFENKHMRFLQQARQLADMGDFAIDYAAAGKNRLLALEHLRKVERKRECDALFTQYPLPDTTEDEDGQLLKRHIDTVITLHRLKSNGVRFVTFSQAALIASYKLEAMTVKDAEDVQKWLNMQQAEQRQGLFERYVQDQMKYPSDHPYTPAPKVSINKLIADLVNTYGDVDLNNDAWIQEQRDVIDRESLLSAQRLISQLIERFGIVVESQTEASSADATIQPAV